MLCYINNIMMTNNQIPNNYGEYENQVKAIIWKTFPEYIDNSIIEKIIDERNLKEHIKQMIDNIIEEELSKIKINVIKNETRDNYDVDDLREKIKQIENNIKILAKKRKNRSSLTYILGIIALCGFGYCSYSLLHNKDK